MKHRHFSAIALLAFFLAATWSAAPRRSSAFTEPPGVVRGAQACEGSTEPGCNSLGISAFQTNRCQLPAKFEAMVSGGTPPYTISVADPAGGPVAVVVTSPDGSTATFEGQLAGMYVVTVRDSHGCMFSTGPGCPASTIACCSLRQEEYGDCTGAFDGCNILSFVRAMNGSLHNAGNCGLLETLDLNLTIGVPGNGLRSLTFNFGSERCLIDKLPASGTAAALPPGLGDAVITSPTSPSTCQLPADCQFPATLPMNSIGKFGNALIGQAIALRLNTRLDNDLGVTKIASTMTTQRVLPLNGLVGFGGEQLDPGPDGVLGTADDPITIVTIPGSVISAIAENSPIAGKFSLMEPPGSVARVLKLANLALAGEPNLGATALEINAAVAAINRAFDRCGFVTRRFDTDTCLQNDDGLLSFNLTTGEYVFTRCGPGGFSITGTGTVTRRGCTVTLQNNLSDRRILVTVDTCQKKGTASGQLFSRGLTFSISDTNTTDNLCACP